MTPPLLCDYAWTVPPPQAIRAAGYVGVLRYLSHDPGKDLTPAELAALHAAGLSVGIVWETTADRALSGLDGGRADGAEANTRADALGWPAGRPVFLAVDFGATPDQLPAVLDYLRGAHCGRPVGVYGSAAVVDAAAGSGLAGFCWQTEAWSGTTVSPHANVYQRVTPTLTIPGVPAGSWDEDVALTADWGGWDGSVTAAASTPPVILPNIPPPLHYTEVNDMAVLVQVPQNDPGHDDPEVGQGRIWLTNGIHKLYVTGPSHLADLVFRGLCAGSTDPASPNVQPISPATLHATPTA